METYTQKINGDEAMKLFRKQANAYQMRCRRAPSHYRREDYEIWKDEMKTLLEQVNTGHLPLEDFEQMCELPEVK